MEISSESDSRRLEELTHEVEELRGRVFQLEQRIGTTRPALVTARVSDSPAISSGIVPVFGRALLGVAGAYLLRAITEMSTLPRGLGVAAGIAYALGWLVWASRTRPDRKIEAAAHGLTSVVVLAPLLWEATIRFRAIDPWASASVIFLFSAIGLASAWRKDLAILAWITILAGVAIAGVLLIATHDVIPFTAALLAMAAAVEFSATLDHWLRERWVVAIVTDLSVVLISYLVTRPGGLPEGYASIAAGHAIAAQLALLSIYLASTLVRTFFGRREFTAFEAFQVGTAAVIAIMGALRIAHGARVISVFVLLAAAACYWVAAKFDGRNLYGYSTFALLLTLTGIWIGLDPLTAGTVLSVLAIAGLWKGARTIFRLHAALYLAIALIAAGPPANPRTWTPALAALCGYVLIWILKTSAPNRVTVLLVAAGFIWTITSLLALAASTGLQAVTGSTAGAATAITFVLTAMSLAMAWLGRKCERFELIWLVYPLMAFAGYRLVTEDLRQGTLALFLSLMLYGGTLVLLPRVRRPGGVE